MRGPCGDEMMTQGGECEMVGLYEHDMSMSMNKRSMHQHIAYEHRVNINICITYIHITMSLAYAHMDIHSAADAPMRTYISRTYVHAYRHAHAYRYASAYRHGYTCTRTRHAHVYAYEYKHNKTSTRTAHACPIPVVPSATTSVACHNAQHQAPRDVDTRVSSRYTCDVCVVYM